MPRQYKIIMPNIKMLPPFHYCLIPVLSIQYMPDTADKRIGSVLIIFTAVQ